MAFDDDGAVGKLVNIVGRSIAFVADIANDLFQYVLERNDPADTAILVHDDREVALRILVIAQQLRHCCAVRYDQRLFAERVPVDHGIVVFEHPHQQVFRQHHAVCVTQVRGLRERKAAVSGIADN